MASRIALVHPLDLNSPFFHIPTTMTANSLLTVNAEHRQRQKLIHIITSLPLY